MFEAFKTFFIIFYRYLRLFFLWCGVLTNPESQDGRDQEEDAGDEDGEGYGDGQGRYL